MHLLCPAPFRFGYWNMFMYAHCVSLELLVLVSFFFSCEILNVRPLQPGCSKWGIVWLDDDGNSESCDHVLQGSLMGC